MALGRGDLLPVVNDGASHGTVPYRTAPLGWDICWVTTRRHDEPMAEPQPHRRYSYPGRGLGVILIETPQRFERVSRTFWISESRECAIGWAVEPPRYTSCYRPMPVKYSYRRQTVVCSGVVGFTPGVNAGILSLKKDSS